MVITDEPGIYLPDTYGVRIEDVLVIEDEGCRVLTHAPKELIVINGGHLSNRGLLCIKELSLIGFYGRMIKKNT